MEPITLLTQKRLILAVTGSIAVYKAVDLASKLTQYGALVDVIMTTAAARFVTPLTFQSVTGRPVYSDMWQADHSGGLPTHIAHVGLGEGADLLLVAPATAHTLARLAHGLADDLLSVTVLAARCPLLVAPAMDGGMYEHPATQHNLELLRSRGVTVIEPAEGRFASGLVGRGRLPETPELLGHIRLALARGGPLAGQQVLVTAGGTREPLDPVRYVTNRSSGRQGYALAQAALDAGAQVTLISTVQDLPTPVGAQLLPVDTAASMHDAVLAHLPTCDLLLMAAAVADYRPAHPANQKIKKNDSQLALELAPTADILLAVRAAREQGGRPRCVVGFAAESQDLLQNARAKLERKGVDLLAANDISSTDAGFEVDTNRVTLLYADGRQEPLPLASKAHVSEAIIARAAALLRGPSESP